MKLSFATLGCPAWTLDQIATNARALGYDGVELRGANNEHVGPAEPPANRPRIKQLFATAGVEIGCIMGYTCFTNDDPAKQDQNVATAIQYLDLARDLGCPCVRVFGGNWSAQTDQAGNIARVVSALKRVAPRAEALGVKLAFETHDSWTKAANLRAVIDGVGSPMLGACWDVANCYHTEPLAQSFIAIRDRIFHVHLKDTKRVDGKIKNVLPGEGEVDLAHAVWLLRFINYTGYLSFEWEKKWDATLAEPEVAFPRYISHCRALLNAES